MPHPRLSDAEIDRRGQEAYERYIRGKVETAENIGKQIVIDVETGDYEIDSDGLAASVSSKANNRPLDAWRWLKVSRENFPILSSQVET